MQLVDHNVVETVEQSPQIAEYQRQLRISDLDAAWERDRQRYYCTSRYGTRYLPNRLLSLGELWLAGIIVLVGGPVLAYSAAPPSLNGYLFWIGVGCLVGGVMGILAFIEYSRAVGYEKAKQEYDERRAELFEQ